MEGGVEGEWEVAACSSSNYIIPTLSCWDLSHWMWVWLCYPWQQEGQGKQDHIPIQSLLSPTRL